MNIIFDIEGLKFAAELFNTSVAHKFYDALPLEVNDLTRWGSELYGSIGIDLGVENPVPEIPEGGIAYTNRGNYICLFFGQKPVWPVEYIGRIKGDEWKKLKNIQQEKIVISKLIYSNSGV